jgi:thiol:disulfide interchange protein
MKNIKPVLLAMLCLFFISGKFHYSHQVKFENLLIQEVMAKAMLEKKVIFIDCYTTWCGPCKKMSAEVFTDSTVATYFNRQFVNLKLDMEKGQGPELASKYGVYEFPTLLFVSNKGEVILRLIGYIPASMLLREARTLTVQK